MTHEELLARISSREVTEWAAFERVHGPIGQRRDDVLIANLAYVVAKVMGAKGLSPDDFLMQWGGGSKPQEMDWRQMLSVAQTVTAAHQP